MKASIFSCELKKNFLLLAIAVGAVGVIIGGYSIWIAVSKLLQP